MNLEEYLYNGLSEECLEVAKVISKILKFGAENINVLNPNGLNNQERLIEELNHVLAQIELLRQYGLIRDNWADKLIQDRKENQFLDFLEYSKKLGRLNSE